MSLDNKIARIDLLRPKEAYDIGFSEGYIKGRCDMLRQVQDELFLSQLSKPIVINIENQKSIEDKEENS